ncbi:MAG: hypothetical protein ACI4F7_13040 [Acutalibacteraceae bacterium]
MLSDFTGADKVFIACGYTDLKGKYQWPRSEQEAKLLTPQQYRWLMEGLQVEQPKAHKKVTGLSII